MIVFRLTKKPYAKSLSGEGAKKFGGRWNSIGTPMLYTSESRALALVELAVHLPLVLQPVEYYLISLEIPTSVKSGILSMKELPHDWFCNSYVDRTQQIGDQFIQQNKLLILKVPSAVVQGDYNILINPNHPAIKKIKILSVEPFSFDERLFVGPQNFRQKRI